MAWSRSHSDAEVACIRRAVATSSWLNLGRLTLCPSLRVLCALRIGTNQAGQGCGHRDLPTRSESIIAEPDASWRKTLQAFGMSLDRCPRYASRLLDTQRRAAVAPSLPCSRNTHHSNLAVAVPSSKARRPLAHSRPHFPNKPGCANNMPWEQVTVTLWTLLRSGGCRSSESLTCSALGVALS